MPEFPNGEAFKQLVKEAHKEWLDEKFAEFGRWAFFSFLALTTAAFTYFILWSNGWTKK